MLVMASRSFEWTFLIKKPLRKYEWPEGQDTPVERPFSVANVLLNAFDLFFNQRGFAWSWSSCPCPRNNTPQVLITSVWIKTLSTFMVIDISHHVLYLISPSIDQAGSSFFGATLPFVPRTISVILATFVGGLYIYAKMEILYQAATLIGRILLRQPASYWPPFFRQPWKATSIRDFWSVRWHQLFRHFFIVFGARPGGALLGWPGAIMGAFTLSGLLHIVLQWAIGRGTEVLHDGGYFIIMGIGMVIESQFERVTGKPVRGWYGWLWTMTWLLLWGSFGFDSWARRGNLAVDFFPDHLRPGKFLINGAISLFSK
jgi:flagellar biosynthesis protein FliQ